MCHTTHKAEEVGGLEEELCLEVGLEGVGAGRQKEMVEERAEVWVKQRREC